MRQHALDAMLEVLKIIDICLNAGGPYHLGERFSLVDLTLAYWAVCFGHADKLDSYSAIRRCVKLVVDRPKLRAKFTEMEASMDDYKKLRVRGEGVT